MEEEELESAPSTPGQHIEHSIPNKQTPRPGKADSATGGPAAAAAIRKNKRKVGGAAPGGSVPSMVAIGGPPPAPLSSSSTDIFASDGLETDTIDETDDGNYNSDSDADLLDGRGRKKGQVVKSKAKAKRVPRQTKPKAELYVERFGWKSVLI